MERMNNARKGIGFGIITNILTILLPFISRTIILMTLGNEYLGLGGLFSSIINVLNITELGFGAAVSYILYKPIADKDNEKVCAIIKFAQKCFFVIGLVVIAIGLAIIPFLRNLISGDIPTGINLYILYGIYLANVVISYMMFAHKRLLLSANQRYDIETNITSITLIAQYLLQIVVLLLLRNYYLYVVVVLLMTVINNILCEITTRKLYPQFFCKGMIQPSEVQVLKKKIAGSFFAKLGETVYLSADNIVISAFFGLLILGQYGNYYYVITSLFALFAVVHNTMRPIIGNCIASEEKQTNFLRFLKFNNTYIWLSSFCACCLLCLYQDFIALWVGNEYLLPFNIVILLTIYFFTGRLSSVPTIFCEASGLWWETRYVSLIAAVVNLTFNIILSYFIGLEGILISSIISSVGINLIGYILMLFRHYFTKQERRIYVNSLVRIVCFAIGCIAMTYLVSTFIHVHNLFSLILKGVIVFMLFFFLYFVLHIRNKAARESWRLVASFSGINKLIDKFKKQ